MATRVRCLKCSKIIECAPYDTSQLLAHIKSDHPEIILPDDELTDDMPADPCRWNRDDMSRTGRKPRCNRKKFHSSQIPRSPQKRRMYKTSIERWRPANGTLYCPKCGCKKRPIIRSRSEKMSSTPAGAACVLTCWPLCFLPCLFSSLTKEYLHCPECNNFLGMYDKEHNCVRPNREFVEDVRSKSSDRLQSEEPKNTVAEPEKEAANGSETNLSKASTESASKKRPAGEEVATFCQKIWNDPLHGRMSFGTINDPWHGLWSKQSGQSHGKMYTPPQELMSVYAHGAIADQSHEKMSMQAVKSHWTMGEPPHMSVSSQKAIANPSHVQMSTQLHGRITIRSPMALEGLSVQSVQKSPDPLHKTEADPSHVYISVASQATEADLSHEKMPVVALKTTAVPSRAHMSTQCHGRKSVKSQATMVDPAHGSVSSQAVQTLPNPSHRQMSPQPDKQKRVPSLRQKATMSHDLAPVASDGHQSFKSHKTDPCASSQTTEADLSHEKMPVAAPKTTAVPSRAHMSTQAHGRKSVKSQATMVDPAHESVSSHAVQTLSNPSHRQMSPQPEKQKRVPSHRQKATMSHDLAPIPSEDHQPGTTEEDASHDRQSFKSQKTDPCASSQTTEVEPSSSVAANKAMAASPQVPAAKQSHRQKSVKPQIKMSMQLHGRKVVNSQKDMIGDLSDGSYSVGTLPDPSYEQMPLPSQKQRRIRSPRQKDSMLHDLSSIPSENCRPYTTDEEIVDPSHVQLSLQPHKREVDSSHRNMSPLVHKIMTDSPHVQMPMQAHGQKSHKLQRTFGDKSRDQTPKSVRPSIGSHALTSISSEKFKSIISDEERAGPSHDQMSVKSHDTNKPDPSHGNMPIPAHKKLADQSHFEMSGQLHGRKTAKSQKTMGDPPQRNMSVYSTRTSHGQTSLQSQRQKSVQAHRQTAAASIPGVTEEEIDDPSHLSLRSHKREADLSHGTMPVPAHKTMPDPSHGKKSFQSHEQKAVMGLGLTSISSEDYKSILSEQEVAAPLPEQMFPQSHKQNAIRLHWKMDDLPQWQLIHQPERKKSGRTQGKKKPRSKSQDYKSVASPSGAVSTRSLGSTATPSHKQMSVQSTRTESTPSQGKMFIEVPVPLREETAPPPPVQMSIQLPGKSSMRKQRRGSLEPPMHKGRSVEFTDDPPKRW